MVKKLLIIIYILFISCAAFAQDRQDHVLTVKSSLPNMSFGVWGIFDMGAHYAYRNFDPDAASRMAIDSNLQRVSRLGLRGSAQVYEDVKAGFFLEKTIHLDTGATGDGYREAYLYINSEKYGKIMLGRQETPTYALSRPFRPLSADAMTELQVTYKVLNRSDNTISYHSPEFSGLSVWAGYSFSARNNERIANEGDISMAHITPMYKSGNFMSALALQNYHMEGDNVFTADIFATYDFGFIRLTGAAGGRWADESDFAVYNNEGKDTKQLMAAFLMPVWKNGSVHGIYVHRSTSVYGGGAQDAKANQYSLVLTQALAKDFRAYLIYSTIINNAAARESALSGGRLASAVGVANTALGYQSGLALGINFAFDLTLDFSSK